ncbi:MULTISPECIES: GFA family protein [Pseudoxanthomonas]|uniref:GFA family protein n=1 Tax=Pseudoxanthomonas TaxID=83618 RepID=UPI0004BB1037|nr:MULTISPECIES: GFA family protein [Pseudoxanthomonas]
MKYAGSCHCGRIAFELETGEPIAEAYDCNCSMCRRRGGLLWFGTREALNLVSLPEDVATYRFNRHHIDHHHCTACGIAPFSEGVDPQSGAKTVAVNVRCLPDVDLATLKIVPVDGASF